MSKIEQSAKRQQNPNTQKSTRAGARFAAGLMGIAAIFGPTACENPATGDKKCDCPAGTVHEPGEKCCDGENCECVTIQRYPIQYLENKEITIEYHVSEAVGLEKLTSIINNLSIYRATGMEAINSFKLVVKPNIMEDGFHLTGAREISIDANWLSDNPEQTIGIAMDEFILDYHAQSVSGIYPSQSSEKFDNAKIRLSRAVIQSRSGLVI
jgi:hypothetical protein